MSPLRPDIVAVWLFRRRDAADEILLLRRAPERHLGGMWQGVTGSIETGERVAAAALREVREETGFASGAVEAFYDLDMVNVFYEPAADAVLAEVAFAMRVSADAAPTLSAEHDALCWVSPDEARAMLVWPAWREAIDRIARDLREPERASWFEMAEDGSKRRR